MLLIIKDDVRGESAAMRRNNLYPQMDADGRGWTRMDADKRRVLEQLYEDKLAAQPVPVCSTITIASNSCVQVKVGNNPGEDSMDSQSEGFLLQILLQKWKVAVAKTDGGSARTRAVYLSSVNT